MSQYRNYHQYQKQHYGDRPGRKSSSKSFAKEFRVGATPTWVRFRPGAYGECEECKGYVYCDAEGTYECKNFVYKDGRTIPTKDGKGKEVCGHKGAFENPHPVAENFAAWAPGGGKRGKGTTVPCNCWKGQRNAPCLLEHYDLTPNSHYAHTLIERGTFHEVKYKAEGSQYENTFYELCEGKRCPHCAKGLPTITDVAKFYNPGYGHYKNLQAIDDQVRRKCLHCEKGYIFPLAFRCPSCDEVMLDLVDEDLDARAKNADFDRGAEGNYRVECQHCHEVVTPIEEPQCVAIEFDARGNIAEATEGCAKPQRVSLFDADVCIYKTGEGNASAIVLKDWIVEPLSEEDLKKSEPIDFQWLCDCPPERQAKALNRPNVFEPKEEGGKPGGVTQRSSGFKY